VLSTGEERYAGQPVSVEAPKAAPGIAGDTGLVLTREARHYAVTAPVVPPVDLSGSDEPLVVQYEVRLQDGLTCGGAYLKLYNATPAFDASTVTGATPYVWMFGPDRCGATDKVHVIARHVSPVSGVAEEKHLAAPPRTPGDKLSHLYTLVVTPANGSYAVLVDGKPAATGALAADFEPPFEPPATIADPDDTKPADWVDEAQIADPSASKPDDWDESAPPTVPDEDAVRPPGWLEDQPASVPDPAAVKPADWDDEEDGEWEPPSVPNPRCITAPGCGPWTRPSKRNPAYRGVWKAPLVANPAYKGPWAPRRLPNPAHFTEPAPWRLGGGAAIGGVGLEVWTMTGGILIDNVLITRDPAVAAAYAAATWAVKAAAEEAATAGERDATSRAARWAAVSQGTWVDKGLFWAGEAAEWLGARVDPRLAVAAAVAAASLLALTLYAACGSSSSGGGKAAAPARQHAGVAVPGSDSEREEAEEEDEAEAEGGDGPALAPAEEATAPAEEAEAEAAPAAEDDAAAPASASKGVRRRNKRA
jgi:calnexin